jgi:glycosyltransferase involved in cell wall biosynthesis
MKLLYAVNDAAFFLAQFLPLAREGKARGWDVHVASADGPGVARMRAEGLTHHVIPLSRSGTHPVDELRVVAALSDLYRRLRPDVVHHITIKPVIYGGWAARLARVPLSVSTISGLGFVFIDQGMRAALRRAVVLRMYRAAFSYGPSTVIFQNEFDRDVFLRARVVRPSQCRIVRGPGVDVEMFYATEEPEGPPKVVLPARILRDKGVGEFVEAAERLRKNGSRARFLLAGGLDEGNPTCISKDEIRRWTEKGSVEWLGHVSDVAALFRSCHIVCLPSYREGFSKALLEASSSARPVVTTDVPGCRDVVAQGQNGILVPPRDGMALAAALDRLLASKELRDRMGAAGRQRVLAQFSERQIVGEVFALYT